MAGAPVRPKAAVLAELEGARKRRDHARSELDGDAYGHLTEQINDLLEELQSLIPPPRPASA